MNMFLTFAIAALIPLFVGFIYYNKNVFGNAWASMTGIDMSNAEEMKKAMPKVMIISYIVAYLMAFALSPFVIHQMGLFSLLQGSAGELTSEVYASKIAVSFDGIPVEPNLLWNGLFRSFGHGALHGTMFGFFMALPMIITMGLYEKKPWKLMLINGGYWIINFALMGGFICQMVKW